MELFSSAFRLFECFTPFLRRRPPPQRAEQCVAQKLVAVQKLPETSLTKAGESEDINSTDIKRKCRKKCRKVPEKCHHIERGVKKERDMNGGGCQKDKAEETLHLEKVMERKTTEPNPVFVEVQPQQTTARPSFLKPIKRELPELPRVSGHLALPAAHIKPLPPVAKASSRPQKPAPLPEVVFSWPCSPVQVDPPKLFAFDPHPTPAPDELVARQCSSTQVCPLSPINSSQFVSTPALLFVDIEDEENEYVEYTGKTIQACNLPKSERLRPMEADIKPRRMIAWMEMESEVEEEARASEVMQFKGCELEENDLSEMGDCEAVQGLFDDSHQKKKEMEERMIKLFCVASPDYPMNETQHHVNVQKKQKSKRKLPPVLFTWEEKKTKKREKQREREMLLERYRNDPKMKHLWINKHNSNYCWY